MLVNEKSLTKFMNLLYYKTATAPHPPSVDCWECGRTPAPARWRQDGKNGSSDHLMPEYSN